MEIIVRKNDLVKELHLVQGIVERKNSIPILSNVLAEAQGGELRISATDLDVSLRCGCAAQVVKEGAITLGAKKLYEIARSLPESDVQHQGAARLLGHHRLRARPLQDGRAAPRGLPGAARRPSREGGSRSRRDVLRELISRTAFAITAEDARYYLAGALLRAGQGERGDGGHRRPPSLLRRSARRRSGCTEPLRVLVPRKAINELGAAAREARRR